MNILVAVDSSPYSQKVCDFLAGHGTWLTRASRYTVLTVVPALPLRATNFVPPDALRSHHEEDAERAFEPFRRLFKEASIEAEFRGETGVPAQTIARLATEGGFDLVLLGSHGDGAMKNLVLGSVCTQVLALCDVPALIIR